MASGSNRTPNMGRPPPLPHQTTAQHKPELELKLQPDVKPELDGFQTVTPVGPEANESDDSEEEGMTDGSVRAHRAFRMRSQSI